MSWLLFRRRAGDPPLDPQEGADWWVARRALGGLTPREDAALQRWLEDPRNRMAYDLADAVHEQAATYAAAPEILALRGAALRVGPTMGPRRAWAIAAGIAVAVLAAGAAAWIVSSNGAVPPAVVADAGESAVPAAKRYETRIGERRDIRLDDGSVVSLNTDSLLEVAYRPARRDVRLLRGQALFRVAHNRSWPFVVTAGDRQVTAVGTAFDVRVDGDRVKVVLLEGKVRVDPVHREGLQKLIPQLAEERLAPGEELVAKAGAGDVIVAAADVQRVTSWRSGRLIFRDDSLGAAVAELNRYSETRIEVEDPGLAALKVSGVFSADRPADFVAAVTTFYPIQARQVAAGVTELTWRDPR